MLSNQSYQTDFNHNISNYQEHYSSNFSDKNKLVKTLDEYLYSFNFELIIDTLNILFIKMYNQPISAVEVLILESVWQNKTYGNIATENNYSSDYFTNVVAPKLFKKLSKLVEHRITKKNCRSMIIKYIFETQGK